MEKLDPLRPSEPKRITNALSADVGVGRIGVGLARDLRSLDRLAPPSSFFGVTSYLHGHNLYFKSPVENTSYWEV